MAYYSIHKRSKPINIICIAALGLLLILLALDGNSKPSVYVICIILMLIAAFAKNNTIVDENCVDNCISMFGLKLHGRWKWEDINYMSFDYTRVAPDVLVTIRKRRIKGSRTARMSSGCIQQILDWAVERNPDIRVDTKGHHNLKPKKRPPQRGRKLAKKIY